MKQFLPIVLILPFTSCIYGEPLHKGAADNNNTYRVEYLFEHEGCKVYRFYDYGRYIYYTNCNGQTIATTDSTAVYSSNHTKK